jgi:hypothetical protein
MANSTVFLVTYKDQEESPYIFSSDSLSAALETVERLEGEYPDRIWIVEEKDVS